MPRDFQTDAAQLILKQCIDFYGYTVVLSVAPTDHFSLTLDPLQAWACVTVPAGRKPEWIKGGARALAHIYRSISGRE